MTDSQYVKLTHFLYRLKVVHGNDFLNGTLRKHSSLAKALLEYEKKHIIELEREILID